MQYRKGWMTITGICVLITGLALFFIAPEPERSVCGNVSPLELPDVSLTDHPLPWAAAVANYGEIQDIPNTGKEWGRFAYYDAGKNVTDGLSHASVRKARWWQCHDLNSAEHPDIYCRFFGGRYDFFNDRYGDIYFFRDYIADADKTYVYAEASLVQKDGSELVLITPSEELNSPDSFDIEGLECSLANMIWILHDYDKTWEEWEAIEKQLGK